MERPSSYGSSLAEKKRPFSLGQNIKFSDILRLSRYTSRKKALVAPVPHLLKSNMPPSEDERHQIKGAIASARARLVSLQEKVTPIDVNARPSKNTGFDNQKTANSIKTFIETQESLLSIIRILPVELLEQIFVSCLPDFESSQWCIQSWRSYQPLHISHTCKMWRDLALRIPQLWTYPPVIDLGNALKQRRTRGGYHGYQFFAEIFDRSCGEDLRLYITASPDYYAQLGHPLVDNLILQSGRWAPVAIDANAESIHILYNTRPQYPKLRKFGIGLLENVPHYGLSLERDTPLLTEFAIRGVRDDTPLSLPYKQIRGYREQSYSMADSVGSVCHVLFQSPNIERLQLIGYRYYNTFDGNILLPNLKIFHLSPIDWTHTYDLLNKLILPSLETLRIAGFPESVVPVLSSLFYRSSRYDSPLRSLYITLSNVYPGALSALLRHTPQLEELNVEFPSLTDLLDLIAGASSHSASPLIPNIRRVVLRALPYAIYGNESTISALTRAIVNRGALKITRDSVGASCSCCGRLSRTSFRLVFPDSEDARIAQLALYKWSLSQSPTFSDRQSRMEIFEELGSLRSMLHEELPELHAESPSRKRNFDTGFSSRVDGIMKRLEEIDLGVREGLAALMSSRILVSMLFFVWLKHDSNPGSRIYMLSVRAERILSKWESRVRGDIAGLHWALKGHRSLVYVPQDDPIRKDDGIFTTFFAMEDDLSADDLDWPHHL